MWMYWLIIQQTSVIIWRSGWEVSTKRCLLGLRETEWIRERVSLTAVQLTLTLMSRIFSWGHSTRWQMMRPRSLVSQRFIFLHEISSVPSVSPCNIDSVMKMYPQQRFYRSPISSKHLVCIPYPSFIASSFCLQMLDARFSHTSLDVFCLPTRMSFLKGHAKVTCNYRLFLLLCDV